MTNFNKISDICFIKLTENDLYFTNKYANLFCNEKQIASNVEAMSFWVIDDLVYYHDMDGLHHYIINNGKETVSDKAIFWETYTNGKAICSYNYKRENQAWHWDIGVFSILENQIDRDYPLYRDCLITKKIDKYYFGLNPQKQICSFDMINNSIKWQFDVSETGKYYSTLDGETKTGTVKYILGEYNNQLIVLLKGGIFIALDVETGQLIWKKATVDVNNTKQNLERSFGDLYYPFFDKETGYIYIYITRTIFLNFQFK